MPATTGLGPVLLLNQHLGLELAKKLSTLGVGRVRDQQPRHDEPSENRSISLDTDSQRPSLK
jgi:hypothetical protein